MARGKAVGTVRRSRGGRTLSRRALGRTTLLRQMLLAREERPVLEAVTAIAGMQSQEPLAAYTGLWSRLAGFRPEQLACHVESGELVRIALMRSTVHLVTADDMRGMRPLVQPVIDRSARGQAAGALAGIDMEELARRASDLLLESARPISEIVKIFDKRWPGRDKNAMTNAIRASLPLVQLPPRGVWGKAGGAVVQMADVWPGAPEGVRTGANPMTLSDLVTRYLAAFGPATVMDFQAWSGLTRVRAVTDPMRGAELVTYTGEDGEELLDIPGGRIAEDEVPAPARFLGDFDNVIFAHADRRRVITEEHRRALPDIARTCRIVLLDGMAGASWEISRRGGVATLTVETFEESGVRQISEIAPEGEALLRLHAPDAEERRVIVRRRKP